VIRPDIALVLSRNQVDALIPILQKTGKSAKLLKL